MLTVTPQQIDALLELIRSAKRYWQAPIDSELERRASDDLTEALEHMIAELEEVK